MGLIPKKKYEQSTSSLDRLVDLLVELQAEEENNKLTNFSEINTGKLSLIKREETAKFLLDDPPNNSTNPEIYFTDKINHQPTEKEVKLEDNPVISTVFVDSIDDFQVKKIIKKLEKRIKTLEDQIYQPTDLINPILPLIKELLTSKVTYAREVLLDATVPIIDKIIKQKASQNSQEMSDALADILPGAITEETKRIPQAIAKAMAPEIAIAIQEQIRLDRDSISNTLGPEMGKAIKTQITLEKDAMVDALYPVIGNTISRYMAEVINQINQKVEHTLSTEGIKRKIKAKIQGVSEAELIFQESIRFTVQAIFLIHKTSGLVIREVQTTTEHKLDSNMVAGMLTAIRSFANDCITQSGEVSELNEIEYSDSKIILEVAGYCYLAIVVKGETPARFIQKARDTLGKIVLSYDKYIEEFEGDPETIPPAVQILLESLIETEKKEIKAKPPITLLLLILIILGSLSIFLYRSRFVYNLEQKVLKALDAAPELSVYRLTPKIKHQKIILTGRVPNNYLKEKATQITRSTVPKFEINNQIIAVDIPPDPTLTREEVIRTIRIFNQRKEVGIFGEYLGDTVKVTGIVIGNQQAEEITQGFKQIPGVKSVINTVQTNLPTLPTKVYFHLNSYQVQAKDITDKIKSIKEFLQRHPAVKLEIIGNSSALENVKDRQELALKRAKSVEKALIDQGINPKRLKNSTNIGLPPKVTKEQAPWLSRCVWFKTFL